MDVLTEFRSAIEIEQLKSQQEHKEEMNLPLEERVAKGSAMSNISVEFSFYDGVPDRWCNPLNSALKYIKSARISCDTNISKFKEGSTVVLSNGEYQFQMEVDEDSTVNFILKPNEFNLKTCYISYLDYPKNNWQINSEKSDITSDMLRVTSALLESKAELLHKISQFLNGESTNKFGKFEQTHNFLNESQNKAYLNAVNASDFCIIQGPPGTGKTETIANIAKTLIDRGLKVFITAPTHTAINNCLNAVSRKVNDGSKVIKIGTKANNRDLYSTNLIQHKPRYPMSYYYFDEEVSREGLAIGATAYSLCYPRTKRLDGWQFDVVIVDEASQLSIPLSIAAMSRCTKYIFVGDHKQLDPIIPKDTGNEMFSESVFSRLAKMYPGEINLLNTSYRLNQSLIDIPNRLFYNSLLFSDPSTIHDDREYDCTHHSTILNNHSHTLTLHSVFDSKGRSPFEAKVVSELVSDLLENGIKLKDIGIMSPYRAQVREIKQQIVAKLKGGPPLQAGDLFVDTVDSMQGQERDYIIYSMANSNPLESKNRLSFFYSPNRLNVAITRAIKKCFVVANYKIF